MTNKICKLIDTLADPWDNPITALQVVYLFLAYTASDSVWGFMFGAIFIFDIYFQEYKR